MVAEHPASGVKRTILGPVHRLWCFLFGWIYYAAKGMWGSGGAQFLHDQWTACDHADLQQVNRARVLRKAGLARSERLNRRAIRAAHVTHESHGPD